MLEFERRLPDFRFGATAGNASRCRSLGQSPQGKSCAPTSIPSRRKLMKGHDGSEKHQLFKVKS